MRSYTTEFPDYAAADLPFIPLNWADESWHNEHCPRFYTQSGVSVFVDYADPAQREFPDSLRFSASLQTDDALEPQQLFATDDWAEMLHYVATFEACEAMRRFNICASPLPESTYAAMREGRLSRSQTIACAAENDAAAKPCPEMRAHLDSMLYISGKL